MSGQFSTHSRSRRRQKFERIKLADYAQGKRMADICRACGNCESLCPVFPALATRREFDKPDLDYLANLCHDCGACFQSCQYAPPHAFEVNLPHLFDKLRPISYADYTAPSIFGRMFRRQGIATAMMLAASIIVILLAIAAFDDANRMFMVNRGAGAYYRVLPFSAIVAIFGAASALAALFIAAAGWRFARALGKSRTAGRALSAGLRAGFDVLSLRHMDGGGAGCVDGADHGTPWRRVFHHLAFYGFLSCIGSGLLAGYWHWVGQRLPPFPITSTPVLLGIAGGLAIIAGIIGLSWLRAQRDVRTKARSYGRLNSVFVAMLLLVCLSGFGLLALRDGDSMGIMLSAHLGAVLAMILMMPFSKFVHGLYRLLALRHFYRQRRTR